ncbi:acetolactate synthase-1/2/3 large subunit [Pseudobutyrivibrio sp. JW11]|uniref:thiamine pyrophosphate-binding protein n=1 Tax=Pseudobutyrivibrio sp. JW11 TaxID=1855302 RepID=UPI0008F0E964|nr:thiamine pyrophosphate-binding protein [Pseudobutyrivibrio sp. JW11]SFO34489.1 acetolactate synthase-1/2/3 large subunit [Pseudobutyrivibrio sp. JW11]
MNVSEFIFDYYSKKGIDTAFMVTGGQAMWLNDAIGKNGNYDIICTHHEQSAAMSADAYGRIKNKPAITLVTAGPGAVNAMNGVVGGYTDSSPMIVISGQSKLSCVEYQEQTGIRQYGVQGIYIKPLAEPAVKYFITIDDPQKIEYYLEKAYHEATTGRPGPVWIDVPLDIQSAQVDLKYLERYEPEPKVEPRISVKQAVSHAYNLLKNAKRPVFIVGQGVALAGAREDFYNYVNKARIPVITARLGIDLMESDNDLYVGRPGNYGERSANIAIQNADLIISVGCRLATSLVGHDSKQFGKNAYIYVVDIDQKELDKPGPNVKYKVKADAKDFFVQMDKELANNQLPDFSEWIAYCKSLKENYPVCLPEYKDEKPVNSYYFVNELSKIADSNAAIMCDTGSCFHVACQTWKLKKGQNYLTTGGLSSMGYWVAGIGACLANDRKSTIVITGDGSLQMNIQEFATIKHNNLPIKTFIFNNNGYLLIRHTQRNFMEDRFVGESPASGVWCPDAMKIAEAYGIKGIRISSVDEVDEKIKEALDYDGPVICEVMTPEWQLLVPRVASEKRPDGTLVSRNYEDMFPYLPKEELEELMIVNKDK